MSTLKEVVKRKIKNLVHDEVSAGDYYYDNDDDYDVDQWARRHDKHPLAVFWDVLGEVTS
jgi:hypothetical protein